jgi:hypothetical protein
VSANIALLEYADAISITIFVCSNSILVLMADNVMQESRNILACKKSFISKRYNESKYSAPGRTRGIVGTFGCMPVWEFRDGSTCSKVDNHNIAQDRLVHYQ